MDLVHAVLLGLIQGITEFLPISSSGHLILPKEIFGWQDQGLAFDVAVHVGTLSAVLIYFRRDVAEVFVGGIKTLGGDFSDPSGRLAWYLVLGTLPAAIAGIFFGDFVEANLRSMGVIAATTIIFGLLLGFADYRFAKTGIDQQKTLIEIGLWAAIIIGCAQALALVPGTSRSGITITAALLLGFNREASAKFSFLLSIPAIVASGAYKSLDLMALPSIDWAAISTGVLVSAVSAYICIHFFLSFINRLGMMPFVYYRMVLGVILIGLVAFPLA
ncbi:MAG: undecaprenyl-diphosphatase [Flavobacteriales bacterium]|jgi:undecaprenyl-diphosphatase